MRQKYVGKGDLAQQLEQMGQLLLGWPQFAWHRQQWWCLVVLAVCQEFWLVVAASPQHHQPVLHLRVVRVSFTCKLVWTLAFTQTTLMWYHDV